MRLIINFVFTVFYAVQFVELYVLLLVYMCEEVCDELDVKKCSHVIKCLTNGIAKLLRVCVRTGTLTVDAEVDCVFEDLNVRVCVYVCEMRERDRE